jgi:hypothetical protein
LGCSIFLLAIAKSYERFFTDHNSRSPDKIKTRLEEIRSAAAAAHDSAVTTASLSAALAFVRILRELRMRLTHTVRKSRSLLTHTLFSSFLIPSLVQVPPWHHD